MVRKPPIQTENEACFYIVQDECFVDLNLYQVGCKQRRPRHRFGPTVPNHFLFHSVISGTGKLETGDQTFFLKPGQGFLLYPGQISTCYADRDDPWTYTFPGPSKTPMASPQANTGQSTSSKAAAEEQPG